VVVIDATGLDGADLETVDAVARAALLVRCCGGAPRLTGAGPQLARLLRLCGLAELLGVEPERQPEHREEAPGVEEEGDTADLPARGLEDLE
jgi:anti-anti-sigma regulatory factor